MTVKRIQLRGISRNPSDRMTADGGVAESINVRTTEQECALAREPKDITSLTFGDATGGRRIVFLHKTNTYLNYLGEGRTGDGRWAVYAFVKDSWTEALTVFDVDERLTEMRSSGNVLVAATDRRTHFFLFTDGAYRYLGDSIPEPKVEFVTQKVDGVRKEVKTNAVTPLSVSTGTVNELSAKTAYALPVNSFASLITDKYGSSAKSTVTYDGTTVTDVPVTELVDTVSSGIWSIVNEKKVELRNEKKFIRPFFARYAVKLLGGYAHVSAPVLVGAGCSDSSVTVDFSPSTDYWTIGLPGAFRCRVRVSFENAAWNELIQSVDIFCSPEVAFPKDNAPLMRKTAEGGAGKIFFKEEKTLEEELLDKSNFYLVESVEVENGKAEADMQIAPLPQDDLLLKKRLEGGYRSGHNSQPVSGFMDYNARLVGCGLRETLPRGYAAHPSSLYSLINTTTKPTVTEAERFRLRFHVRNADGMTYAVMAHWLHGDITFSCHWSEPSGTSGTYDVWSATSYGFIAYPDTRCYKVELIDVSNGKVVTLPMKEHPHLDCSYWFGGSLTKELLDYASDGSAQGVNDVSENREYVEYNRLVMSDVDNPFLFPAGGRLTFGAKVTAVATTTVALATGQYDTAPLYVFTEDGIEAQRINADGSFATHSPISRDVATKGSICPIDKAIVFSGVNGVMLLEGSRISCLSSNMVGKHYVLEDDASVLVARSDWAEFADVYSDGEDFLKFVKDCRYAYDCQGRRILAFSPGKDYQYAYDIDAGTWHKTSTVGMTLANTLNGYPDTMVCMRKNTANVTWLAVTAIEGQLDDAEAASAINAVLTDLSEEQCLSVVRGESRVKYSSYDAATQSSLLAVLDSDEVRAVWSLDKEETFDYRLFDFSVPIDEQSTTPRKVFIATRPFDLDEPDVRKQVGRIIVRGRFGRQAVRYVLLGSMDGRNFVTLPSLRSGSFKWYRLILLAALAPQDRISWVDVEFESRFGDRLR